MIDDSIHVAEHYSILPVLLYLKKLKDQHKNLNLKSDQVTKK